jgi:hypothetical protein
MEAPAVCVRGKLIARRAVVKYVANKLGGAHIDPRRTGPYAVLESAVDVTLLGKPAVYFELLSIGQALANSEDAERFVAESNS